VARPHIEFIRAQDVSESDPAEPFRGARERRLSTDDETGAYTSVMAFADGWSGDLSGGARPIEIFVLRGEIELGGRCLAPGCYVYLESGVAAAKLDALTGALALVMVNDERPASPTRAWEIVDTEQMPFEPSSVVGLVIKKLRVDPKTGEWTWLAGSAPNRVTPHAEVHPTVEEAFLIRGDCLLGEYGEMTPGSYFWRPAMVKHGPLATRNGTFFFFRTKGGGLETTYHDVPGWEESVRAYRAAEPYFRGDV
jgi:hypothetical protein